MQEIINQIKPPGMQKKNRGAIFRIIGRIGQQLVNDAVRVLHNFFPLLADDKTLELHAQALSIPHFPFDTQDEFRERVSVAGYYLDRQGQRGLVREILDRLVPDRYQLIEYPKDGFCVGYTAFSRNVHGDVYDDENQRHDLYYDESITAGFVEGEESTQAEAVKPVVENNIIIADILIDSSTSFESFTPSYERREIIPTIIDLKNRLIITQINITETSEVIIPFTSMGLPNGSYSVYCQLVGSNTAFIRNLAIETTGENITLRLYHDSVPYSLPVLGAPPLKIGGKKVGEFIIGNRDTITVNLFIRKEDLL
ncbi:MAG: hypothetical protein JXB88_26035 [Spirochaetales bacterium]|nr:hypothetical protein [Spirochaetales bacterium]